jgi:hypothetical protein
LWRAHNSIIAGNQDDQARPLSHPWQTDDAGAGARVIAFVDRTRRR